MPAAGMIDCVDPIGCVVARHELPVPPMLTPAERNVRPREEVYPQDSPTPPAQGDTPARPARYPFVTFQAIAPILSVMRDEFIGSLQGPVNNASVNFWRGGNSGYIQPWGERVNVHRDPSRPYGSSMTLESESDQYYLLMGAR